MKKNIYDLLNDVEIDLTEYDQEGFTDIEKKKFKNSYKKSIKKNNIIYKKYASIALIALLTIGLLGVNLGGSVWANINMIAFDLANYLGIEKDLDDYKTVVNKSIAKTGVTIQLNEVILDHNQLVVSSTLTSSTKLGEYYSLDSSIYVNGKKINSGASGSSKLIDEYTAEEVMFHDLEDNFSGDLDIKIVFSDPVINGSTKSGRWVFEFKTNGDELVADTKEILIDYTFALPNGQSISLEKYTSNNLGQKIYFSKSSKDTSYNMVLKGHDDLGNKVEFFMSRTNGCNGIFNLETIDGNLNENANKLSLTPYTVKLPEQSGKMSHDFKKVGEEFTIDLLK